MSSLSPNNNFFRVIKPVCVNILTLSTEDSTLAVAGELTEQLNLLLATLKSHSSILNECLANYIFVPLSHVFRQRTHHPARLLEPAVASLKILIESGWDMKSSPEHVRHLFILLVFLLESISPPVPEELHAEVLLTLNSLLRTNLSALETPTLGSCISHLLDTVTVSPCTFVQLRALDSLDVACSVFDQESLTRFFPGIVSSLARLLAVGRGRQKSKMLVKSLDVIKAVSLRVLGDLHTRTSDLRWLDVTCSQFKLALTRIIKLRNHRSNDVQTALSHLCLALLDQCRRSLSCCSLILVETVMALPAAGETSCEPTLRDLAFIHPEIADQVKLVMHSWIYKIPLAMEGKEHETKEMQLLKLVGGLRISHSVDNSPTLAGLILVALRDAVTACRTENGNWESYSGSCRKPWSSRWNFSMFIYTHRKTRSAVLSLLHEMSSQETQKITTKLLSLVLASRGQDQLAAHWLALELLKSSSESHPVFGLSTLENDANQFEQLTQELYQHSVDVITTETVGEPIWPAASLAMETIVHVASRMGTRFRSELIDVLYPIAVFLGSPLHQNALAALQSVSASCCYQDVAHLIVDNADYVVNTAALRLNALDISPTTASVLQSTIRLAGPSLVPFMDDLVDAIFGALENYHGYSALVDGLFSVLREIAGQASFANKALRNSAVGRRPDQLSSTRQSVEEISASLKRRHAYLTGLTDPAKATEPTKLSYSNDKDPASSKNLVQPKSYAILHRVMTLSQHFLTSPAPLLRRSLLELIATVTPVLATDEEHFLPLVNSIWPMTLDRLWDTELFVTVMACDALAALCETAGDFLITRFESEWASRLRDWICQAKDKSESSVNPSSVAKEGSPISPEWDAVKRLLASVVRHVKINESIFDEVCVFLAEDSKAHKDLEEALISQNKDSLWLVRYVRGEIPCLKRPACSAGSFGQGWSN